VTREFWGRVRGLLADEQGQGTVEYIMVLSFAVVGAAALGRAVLAALDEGIQSFGGQLEKDLKTGRMPVGIWRD
jgi:hypothetical protein